MIYSASARPTRWTAARCLLRLAAMLVCLATAMTALAESEQTAEQLFEQGRALMRVNDIDGAIAKFEASMQASPSVGALVNLARCHELEGKTATAAAEYRRAAALADAEKQPERAKAARKLAAALAPKLSHVTVSVAEPVERLKVRVGGKELPLASYGKPFAVDPGEVAIEASAPGHKTWTESVEVGPDADSQQVQVPKLEPGQDEPAAASAPTTPASGQSEPGAPPDGTTPAQEGGWTAQHTAAVVVGGVGIAGIVIGAAFGAMASSQWDEALTYCNDENTADCSDEAGPLSQDAVTSATVSTVGFVVGGAAVATAVVLFLTAPSGEETPAGETAWLLAPTVGPAQTGLQLRATF
ncbi:MAG: hypothetical protein JRI23_15530 [Deltaproteobacteria bacterium]|jgi:serine/threonine-protein kinase|nr:hypothetical protein [Deltaproteobacteria bacterium]MBW2533164.1 hypothetical protein [Deltaproteobacteria bacterium]